ncbi:flagellar biosynthesis anti-sigma factor FlgM [Calderihabitans maritimus]|uniref:Negative regulator of flagellin synthesis n=1 Tax=Calderihabitans maritimus TaxID=1246530 RepID=A0A1Z5HUD8_9FIRM|nr:flagellar biosynthesis anti-sigma factor FlgM [Calderihabitans maritimus]GAW92900.1 anti-sigma-28 factor FlgM [Calderihabitans maritimus]
MKIERKTYAEIARTYLNHIGDKNRKVKKPDALTSDTVNLSSEARELQGLIRKAAEYPEIRPARVEQLQQELAKGTYRIPAEKIAEKLLENFREKR